MQSKYLYVVFTILFYTANANAFSDELVGKWIGGRSNSIVVGGGPNSSVYIEIFSDGKCFFLISEKKSTDKCEMKGDDKIAVDGVIANYSYKVI